MTNNDIILYNKNNFKDADFTMWMAFPGITSFALSSLGFLWIYKSIDELDDVNIEMICSDTEKTKYSPNQVNLFGFSFTFDTDFLTIFSMLEKYKIPFLSKERENLLLFAGGPVVSANPEPYKDIFDFFIIGDGEAANMQVVKICKQNKDKSKEEVLSLLNEVEGVYVPALVKKPVKKLNNRLAECIYTPILSENAFFKNTFIIELARGCSNRCGFCLASYLNLPFRFMPYEALMEKIELGLKHTNKIALLGAQITAHPKFEDICDYVYSKIQNGEKIEMSVSSLRVDSINEKVIKTLVSAGQKNSTLAIEAGSERLRRVINKNLTEEQIFKAVDIAKNNGLKGLKFYGMIGLPTETQEDLDETINLARKLKEKYKGFDISFGFSSFVPKPHTPFQWCGREDTKTLEAKSNFLRRELHKLGIKANVSSIKWDYWQAVLSRGDGSFTQFLIDTYKNGGNIGAFKSAARQNNIDIDAFAYKNIDLNEELPWDFIQVTPGKDFLKSEHDRLLNIN